MSNFELQSDHPVTRSHYAELALRQAILDRRLQPGERLNTTTLAGQLKVSPTPLREALQRLAAAGLVTQHPQRGAFVADLSPQDLEGIYELRNLLEVHAAEKSVERLSSRARDEIARTHIRLAEVHTDPTSSRRERETIHREFHAAVVADCGSPRLLGMVAELVDLAARYRIVATDFRGGEVHALHEHLAIASAALEGDAARTRVMVAKHLSTTYNLSREHLERAELDGDKALPE